MFKTKSEKLELLSFLMILKNSEGRNSKNKDTKNMIKDQNIVSPIQLVKRLFELFVNENK